jgi:hypothetical protein
MDDDDEIHLHVTYASHLDMDEAFCTRMRMAIEAGLEHTPIGVITTVVVYAFAQHLLAVCCAFAGPRPCV